MTSEEFNNSLLENIPPPGLTPLLLALWYDAKGDWERSHSIVQDIESNDAALIHAYLHRKEGDEWNADYWYKKSGSKRPPENLDEEWKKLVRLFL
jgi:hypothetical protein